MPLMFPAVSKKEALDFSERLKFNGLMPSTASIEPSTSVVVVGAIHALFFPFFGGERRELGCLFP